MHAAHVDQLRLCVQQRLQMARPQAGGTGGPARHGMPHCANVAAGATLLCSQRQKQLQNHNVHLAVRAHEVRKRDPPGHKGHHTGKHGWATADAAAAEAIISLQRLYALVGSALHSCIEHLLIYSFWYSTVLPPSHRVSIRSLPLLHAATFRLVILQELTSLRAQRWPATRRCRASSPAQCIHHGPAAMPSSIRDRSPRRRRERSGTPPARAAADPTAEQRVAWNRDNLELLLVNTSEAFKLVEVERLLRGG